MKTLLAAALTLACLSTAALAQAPNDISSKLSQGKAYSDTGSTGAATHRRHRTSSTRHHTTPTKTATPAAPAPAPATTQ